MCCYKVPPCCICFVPEPAPSLIDFRVLVSLSYLLDSPSLAVCFMGAWVPCLAMWLKKVSRTLLHSSPSLSMPRHPSSPLQSSNHSSDILCDKSLQVCKQAAIPVANGQLNVQRRSAFRVYQTLKRTCFFVLQKTTAN